MKHTVSLLALSLLVSATLLAQDKPRIYVTDKPMDQASFLATRNAAVANIQRGDDPRTTEIQADIVKICPHVTVTSQIERADYVLVFRRQNGKRSSMFVLGGLSGLALSAFSKVDGASLFNSEGDMVTATKQRTVEKSIRELCGSIPKGVAHRAATPAVAATPSSPTPSSTVEPVEPTLTAPAPASEAKGVSADQSQYPGGDAAAVTTTEMSVGAAGTASAANETNRDPDGPSMRNDSSVSVPRTTVLAPSPEGMMGVWFTGSPSVRHDGIEIAGVQPKGPAANIEIKPGDVILAIDDRYLYTIDELRAELLKHEAGARLAIRYRHNQLISDNHLTLVSKDGVSHR